VNGLTIPDHGVCVRIDYPVLVTDSYTITDLRLTHWIEVKDLGKCGKYGVE
jgi:hypothetical protein